MSLGVHGGGLNLRPLLADPPKIIDQLNGVCRRMEVPLQGIQGLPLQAGQPIELWYGGKRWYYGIIVKLGRKSDGTIALQAYDPLWYLKRDRNDYYFKQQTATQAIRQLADATGITVASLAGTGAVFDALYYHGAEASRIAIDLLARTYNETGKKFWFRYQPDADNEGLVLFERTPPSQVWAFQVGVNLEAADYEEDITQTSTVVRLINRETGKTVEKADGQALGRYGNLVHFEEVSRDAAESMDKRAQELLDTLSKVTTTMSAAGSNPDQTMDQFFSGDLMYVEEENTSLIGAYHIRNVVQSFESDNLVRLEFDIQAAPDIPQIQYAGTARDQAQQQTRFEYSEEILRLMEKYGLEPKDYE